MSSKIQALGRSSSFLRPTHPHEFGKPICQIQPTQGFPGERSLLQLRGASGSDPAIVPPIVHEVLNSPGQPLDTNVRSSMEAHFNRNLSQVRIHTDKRAAESATAVNALAYTVQQDIIFGAGQYRPETNAGQQLIAHELAHTLQQGAGNPEKQAGLTLAPLSSRAEQEAEMAASTLSQSQISTPTVAVAPNIARQTPVPSASATPSPASTWKTDVDNAKAIADAVKRRDALVALVKQALGTTYQVHVAGNSSPQQVDPKDYKVAPVINFDVNLNNKKSWPSQPGAATRSLSNNAGYSFNSGNDLYVVIGPNAVESASPLITRMYAEHELYHTQHHLGKSATPGMSSDDEELEAWTQDFLKFFHQYLSIPIPAGRPAWSPLIDYYEKATSAAQKSSLNKLVNYYNQPPVPATEVGKVQRAFHSWLSRRLKDTNTAKKKLIIDLNGALPQVSSPTAAPATPTPSANP